jgi:diguanylate cyclase (GGDEF)-like protein/PAS domain S-box-containing protein
VGFEIERERLKELFQHTSDGVMVIDRALRIVALNPSGERLTACSADTTVGRRVCNEVAVCQNAEGFELCETACPGLAALERVETNSALDVNLPARGGQVAPAVCVPMSAEDGSRLAMILIRDVSDRTALEEEILSVERVDRVSGLYARTYFDDLYRRELKLAERQRRTLAVVLISLSGDVLDGPEADQVIRVVGEAVRASLRKKVDIAGRYDHDAFAIVLLDTDSDGAASLTSRIEARLAAQRAEGRLGADLSVSCGVGSVLKDGYAGLLKAARSSLRPLR